MKEKNKNQTAFFMKRKQRLVRPGGLGLLRADRARLQQCFDSSGSARVSLIQKSIKIFLFLQDEALRNNSKCVCVVASLHKRSASSELVQKQG